MLTATQRASFARVNTEREFIAWLEAEAARTATTLRTAPDTSLIYRAQGKAVFLEELLANLKSASGA